jgi:hypothetical protein
MWPALLALIEAALTVAPELVKDVEQLLADLKAKPDTSAPMTPEVKAAMDPLEGKLTRPIHS